MDWYELNPNVWYMRKENVVMALLGVSIIKSHSENVQNSPIGNVGKQGIEEGKVELRVTQGFTDVRPVPALARNVLTSAILDNPGGTVSSV